MRNLLARAVLVTVCCTALVGCGLRLETDDPAPLTAGVSEHARARTVADAAALADAAWALADDADQAVAPVLDDIVAFSTTHIHALGETYEPGTTPSTAPGATPTEPAAVPTTTAGLLDLLATATSTCGADTDAVDDGDLARVLGSVTTSRGELTVRLAQALGVDVPATTPAPRAATDPLPSAAGPLMRSPTRASALVLAHDQAGYAFEVVAALAVPKSDPRATAEASAEYHRGQASTWARDTGIAGTADDPRRAQYQLPDNLSDPAAVATMAISLEQAVAQGAAAGLADSDPGARAGLLAELRAATAAATTWGAPPQPLPGLPAAGATPTPSPTP
ncbi:MAG: ferritin-like domain-containing protein [Micrococcales bacterium]|nr:ferritin-like domain-containing protein [Micrococcales bacterium]